MIQYPEGVDFGDEKAQLVFGIAGIGDEHLDLLAKIADCLGIGDEHLDLLAKIADCLDDLNVLEKMKTTEDKDWIIKTLS